MAFRKIITIIFAVFSIQSVNSAIIDISNDDVCKLPIELTNEIDNYAPQVSRIINAVMNDSFRGSTWLELANFVDKFGSRFTGTQNLEDSIDYVLNKSMVMGLENVHGESVTVPRWVRGQESATLLTPRIKDIKILGLGYSVGTPENGITAEAIVVKSFEELQQKAAMVSSADSGRVKIQKRSNFVFNRHSNVKV